uniref:Uncharacterized protein n=1 Tax=Anguilla anguilla TaxID=7936 RepID=A0A0E9PBJ7_ANGAN
MCRGFCYLCRVVEYSQKSEMTSSRK